MTKLGKILSVYFLSLLLDLETKFALKIRTHTPSPSSLRGNNMGIKSLNFNKKLLVLSGI
jgi:hypothetical protein